LLQVIFEDGGRSGFS